MAAEAGIAPSRASRRASRGHASATRRARQPTGPYSPLRPLQRSAGNAAVTQLLSRHPIAPADSAAERSAAAFAASGARPAHASSAAGDDRPAALSGSQGRPLEPAVRRPFEQALRADLSAVRVHDDSAAHDLAHFIHARAGTLGSHIFFSAGRFAPSTDDGRTLLGHELVHTLQPEAREAVHRTPESEARLADIERQLASQVIADDYRRELEAERDRLLREGNVAPPRTGRSSAGAQPVKVISMSADEFEQRTGMSAALLPDAPADMIGEQELPSRVPSGIGASLGLAAPHVPEVNWYYRVLSSHDPSASQILRGADLLPRPPDPGFTFKPASSAAEMTFRHTRPGGNVPQVGTDRISTAAELESFKSILRERGTGELVRVDVDAARRLGAQFLEQGDVMKHLEEIGAQIAKDLAEARAAGRGANFIARLEGRLRALEAAKAYVRTFGEGHGVGNIPSGAITKVRGPTLGTAVAGEQALTAGMKAFKAGGRVFIVVGVAMSVERIATAPEGQRGRVATQEAGGWAFSLAGAEAGAGAGAMLGATFGIETGPGAVALAVFGALVGGAIGFFGGQEAADKLYDVAETLPKAGEILNNPAKMVETSQWMFGTPESRRDYYELRELETGEPSPFDF
jgi:Domain of unknown function (DUF4157)